MNKCTVVAMPHPQGKRRTVVCSTRKEVLKMTDNEEYSLAELLNPDVEPFVLRAPEVAILLGCGPDAARTLMKSDGFPITFVGTRNYIVLKRDLLQWLDDLVLKERGEL